MASWVQSSMYGIVKTYNTTKNGYVIQITSESYTLQNNTQLDGQVISDGGLFFKAQYFWSMQEIFN